MLDKRPPLNNTISIKDFKEFYWLKEELIDFCSENNLPKGGSKIEITERIAYFLTTGLIKPLIQKGTYSNFDWKNATLTKSTTITDNYKNTENVRAFFTNEIGKKFKFNIKFMKWIKENVGKTLEDAIDAYNKTKIVEKNKNIAPQFEYNTYLRDFLEDNTNLTRETGIKLWNIKKSLRGNNVYHKDDLKLLKS